MLGEADLAARAAPARASRLTSMMAPTIALGPDGPRLVVGSAGSARLRGAILQVVVNALGRGLDAAEAIERPRVHAEDGHVHCEDAGRRGRCSRPAGYDVVRWPGRNLYFGGAAAVELLPDGGLAAAGDSRRGGAGWSSCERDGAAGAARRRRRARRARERRRRRAGGLADLRRDLAQRRRRAPLPARRPPARRRGRPASRRSTARSSAGSRSRRDPHPASRHVADLGLMVAARTAAAASAGLCSRAAEEWARGAGVDEAGAARLPLERAGDRALRGLRLRARGLPPPPLPPRRRARSSTRS